MFNLNSLKQQCIFKIYPLTYKVGISYTLNNDILESICFSSEYSSFEFKIKEYNVLGEHNTLEENVNEKYKLIFSEIKEILNESSWIKIGFELDNLNFACMKNFSYMIKNYINIENMLTLTNYTNLNNFNADNLKSYFIYEKYFFITEKDNESTLALKLFNQICNRGLKNINKKIKILRIASKNDKQCNKINYKILKVSKEDNQGENKLIYKK